MDGVLPMLMCLTRCMTDHAPTRRRLSSTSPSTSFLAVSLCDDDDDDDDL